MRVNVNTDGSVLEVRYTPEALERLVRKLTPMVRRQALAVISLGSFWGLVIVIASTWILLSEGTGAVYRVMLFLLVLLPLPLILIAAGVRRIGFRPNPPEIVMRISDSEVIFAPVERVMLFRRSRPERRWDRRATEAKFLPRSHFTQDRIKYTLHAGGRRRTEYQGLDDVDTPVDVILAAVRRP